MITGLTAGVFWAVDSVILGIALSMSPFIDDYTALMLAPFISTFIHDFASAIYMWIYVLVKKQTKRIFEILKTKSGKFIVIGSLLGGPVGMSGYVAAIKYMGPSYTAIISSLFPAFGAFFSYVFLKNKMTKLQLLGLLGSIIGVIVLGFTPNTTPVLNMTKGLICGIICCVGWAMEAVILEYGLKDETISDKQALTIRQSTSSIVYAGCILTMLKAWPITINIMHTSATMVIILSALFGTLSYILYYKAITKLGATKSMALNITYTVWAMVLSIIFLKQYPSVKDIICGIVIVSGALIAATDLK